MSFRRGTPSPKAAQPDASDADAIAWEYEDERFAGRGVAAAVRTPETAPQADARTVQVQQALTQALDMWWRRGVLPSQELLREGLLTLQAGHELDESQRTLLLRTALAYRRGVITALRHQTDPERTAVVLHEALVQPVQPLTLDELARLHAGDEQSAVWGPILAELLRTPAAVTDGRLPPAPPPFLTQGAPLPAAVTAAPAAAPWVVGEATSPPRFGWLRVLLWLLLPLAVAAGALWWWWMQPAAFIVVPAGSYPVSVVGEATPEMVTLPAYRIDRQEATVAEYRRCYERGRCPWPASSASATRPNYLLDPAFAAFPMINIDYDSADRFCRFQGKRLPTAAEWEVAAAFAPATARMYRFPWGDEFAPQRANGAATGSGDTVQVGSFRPAGNSSLGGVDMAGNVAEWSATLASDGTPRHVVKGGSFLSEADDLRTSAAAFVASRTAAAWLGVRCAADIR